MTKAATTNGAMIKLEAVRVGLGSCELLLPAVIDRTLLHGQGDAGEHDVIRVLGARHLVQGLLTGWAGRPWHLLGGVVDLLHSSSMVLLAVVDRKRRTPAAVSAAVALSFGIAEFVWHRRQRSH